MPVTLIKPTKEEAVQNAFLAAYGHKGKDVALKAFECWKSQEEHIRAGILDAMKCDLESKYIAEPVDPLTFLVDPGYLGLKDEIYYDGCVVPEFVEMNSGNYVEVVCTGGIGSAKTTLALWGMARQLYLLSLLRNAHRTYGIAETDEILFVFQSITKQLSSSVDYDRFKNLILRSPYFQKHFPPDSTVKSELRFPNRVIVRPVSGSSLAAIGQNVFGALIDELNYMAVVDQSRKSHDAGTFDQATEIYNAIARRRVSRFYSQGALPGILFLVSSKKYPGQFTDKKMEEREKQLKETGKSHIYVYDKRMWDIKPSNFSQKKMRIFIGDEFRKPRILPETEPVLKEDEKHITLVPEDLRDPFEKDIVNALREIAGISHFTKHPFFVSPEPLVKMFKKNVKPIFNAESVDFEDRKLELFKSNLLRADMKYPRYAHIDLGVTGDAAGLCIAHVEKFIRVDRDEGLFETMPYICVDGVLEITPPRGGQIMFFKIRRILYLLMELGIPIRWASLDSFQSVDSLQILMQKGLAVGNVSTDKTTLPYDMLKSAVLDYRISCAPNANLFSQLRDLQMDFKNQKIDHLPTGKKDVADSLACCVYGLTTRREIWHMHEVPISESVMHAVKKQDNKMKETRVRENTDEPIDVLKNFWGLTNKD